MTTVDVAPAQMFRHCAGLDPETALEPGQMPGVERICGPQRQSDAVERNRVIETDGFQRRDCRAAVDKIIFACTSSQPRQGRSVRTRATCGVRKPMPAEGSALAGGMREGFG